MPHKRTDSLLQQVLISEGTRLEKKRWRQANSMTNHVSPEQATGNSEGAVLSTQPLNVHHNSPGRSHTASRHPFPLNLPINNGASPRAFCYGYFLTDELMYQYLVLRVGQFINQSEIAELHITQATILCLKRETGIRTPLVFMTAHVDGTNKDYPRWENPARIPIIAVCSDRHGEFERRPTQQQIDKLRTLLCSEPRWWLDSWFTEDFE